MRLSGRSIETFQICPRRWRIYQDWTPNRKRPRGLFETILRDSVRLLSAGGMLQDIQRAASAGFLEVAANVGLDVPGDTYTIAQDYAACLQTVLQVVSEDGLSVVRPIVSQTEWEYECLQDDSGQLHYWGALERIDPSHLSALFHSWRIVGDMAQWGGPLSVHLVELGPQRGAHLHSPWCRTFKHPAIHNRFQFQQRSGKKLEGAWKACYYQDMLKQTPEDWVAAMRADNVPLIRHYELKELSETSRKVVLDEIKCVEEYSMSVFSSFPWYTREMSRGACDLPYECPCQGACYSPSPEKVDFPILGFRKAL